MTPFLIQKSEGSPFAVTLVAAEIVAQHLERAAIDMAASVAARDEAVAVGENIRGAVGSALDAAQAAADAASIAQGTANFRGTLAEALAAFPIGAYFSSAEMGETRVYKRIADAPGYLDQGDAAAPVNRTQLAFNVRSDVAQTLAPQAQALARGNIGMIDRALDPCMFPFNAVGNGETDDRAAVALCLQAGREQGRPVVIRRPHYIGMTKITDPLRLLGGERIYFEGPGQLVYDTFGLPLLYVKDNDAPILIDRPRFLYKGRASTALPALVGAFYDTLKPRVKAFPTRDVMAAIGLFGADDVVINRAEFAVPAGAGFDQLMPIAITLSDHADGTLSRNIQIDNTVLDGTYFGILAWGFDGLYLRRGISRRWGQLPLTFAWQPAAHAIYITTQVRSRNAHVNGWRDLGTEVAPDFALGSTSYKVRGVEGLSMTDMHSLRGAGLTDISGTSGYVSNLFWRGTTNAAMVTNKAMRILAEDKTAGYNRELRISDVTLIAPVDLATQMLLIGEPGTTGQSPDNCRQLELRGIRIQYEGDGATFNGPFIIHAGSNCLLDTSFALPNITGGKTLIRIDQGGSKNRLQALVNSPIVIGAHTIAAISGGGSTDNSAEMVDARTGAKRQLLAPVPPPTPMTSLPFIGSPPVGAQVTSNLINTFQWSDSAATPAAFTTGINVNLGNFGGGMMVQVSTQYGVGNATSFAMYLIRFGYSASSIEAIRIAGSDGTSAGSSNWVFSVDQNSVLTAQPGRGGNHMISYWLSKQQA